MTKKTSGFGERVKKARAKMGLTQNELGIRAGIQASIICHFESGRREPNVFSIINIATALGVSTDALLGISRP